MSRSSVQCVPAERGRPGVFRTAPHFLARGVSSRRLVTQHPEARTVSSAAGQVEAFLGSRRFFLSVNSAVKVCLARSTCFSHSAPAPWARRTRPVKVVWQLCFTTRTAPAGKWNALAGRPFFPHHRRQQPLPQNSNENTASSRETSAPYPRFIHKDDAGLRFKNSVAVKTFTPSAVPPDRHLPFPRSSHSS